MSPAQKDGLVFDALWQDHFLPVSNLQLTDEGFESGTAIGFAAPSSGLKPCALALQSSGQTISVARAVRFSDNARGLGIRRGWCGFLISGLEQCLSLNGSAQLRCAVSNQLLHEWTGEQLSSTIQPRTRQLVTVNGMRERLLSDGCCQDLDDVISFAIDLGHSSGSRAVLEASYHYLLSRGVDRAAEQEFSEDFLDEATIRELWRRIKASDEFRARAPLMLPGPFDPGFAFPLEGLNAAS